MCEPFSLMALAASAGMSMAGQAMNNAEQQRNQQRQAANARAVANARNAELEESKARMKRLSDQNDQVLQHQIGQFQPEQQKQVQQDAQNDATKTFQSGVAPAVSGYQVKGDAPSIVQSTFDKSASAANQRGLDAGAKLGLLDSYKGSIFQNNLGLQQAGRQIDTNNGFAQQEAALLPGYQDLAQNAVSLPNGGAKPMSGVGDIFMGLGKLGGSYAGTGKAAAAGSWFS